VSRLAGGSGQSVSTFTTSGIAGNRQVDEIFFQSRFGDGKKSRLRRLPNIA